jgi:ribonucleoside-diphosphate reductase alpha chain
MVSKYLGINIDLERDNLFDAHGLLRLKESYMAEGETSPQQRFAFVAKEFGTNPEHTQRLYDYASKHWLSFSTPILAYGRDKRSLPISCFLPWMYDTREGLVETLSESNWLSMLGGGIGIGIGIRPVDEKSAGVIAHMKTYDASSLAYKQGRTRRGSYAMYLDIRHPDIIQFLEMRKPTGDANMRCLNLHHAINIPDSFMKIIEKCMIDPNYDDSWSLIDPNTKQVKEVVSAKDLWQRLIELRMHTGEPYILFIDNANKTIPWALKECAGYEIRQSNLCTEILEWTDEDRTAVCCLSSVNAEKWSEWQPVVKQFYRDILEMLDNVLTVFIKRAPKEIKRAIYSAKMERSVGIGVLGWHALLQQNGIPFESAQAKGMNLKFFGEYAMWIDTANVELANERGVPEDCAVAGIHHRCTLTRAIAPNASSSIIMGNTSPSIEPFRANAYLQDTMSGSFLNKNKYLDQLIKRYCADDSKLDYDDIWSSIISNDGSAQHLEFLSDWEREVFKTSMELNQRWVVQHAADRTPFIDQGQSLNLFFLPNANIKYVHAVHFEAWKTGLKTLYYCRSEKIGKADKLHKKIQRDIIEEIDLKAIAEGEECLACQ